MSIQNLRMMRLDRIEEDRSGAGAGKNEEVGERINLRDLAKKHGKRQKDKISGGD